MGTQAISSDSRSGVLNVLFHGAYTFTPEKGTKQVLAMMPHMQHHVYRAGNWLAETDLRGRNSSGGATVLYELKGVDPAPEFNIPDGNLIVKYSKLPETPVPHVTIKLPYPHQLTSLRVADIPTSSFGPPEKREELKVQGETQHMSTLQIFTYTFEDDNALALRADHGGGHYWEPAFTGDHIDLHIFAAEDHFHKFSSPQEDLNKCIELLGVDLRLNTRFLPAGEIPDPKDLHGIAKEEAEELATRTRRMARLGRLVSQGLDPALAWHGNDVLDGDGHACGPIWGDPDGL